MNLMAHLVKALNYFTKLSLNLFLSMSLLQVLLTTSLREEHAYPKLHVRLMPSVSERADDDLDLDSLRDSESDVA